MDTPDYAIYGRKDCGYCRKAVQLCLEEWVSFLFITMTAKGISEEVLARKNWGQCACCSASANKG